MKLLLTLITFCISIASFAQVKSSPSKNSVMLDGKFSANEWSDATELKISDSLALYIKHDKENVFLCLRGMTKAPVLGGVDFYIVNDNETHNLHASAQLGERKLVSASYGDYTWWNNDRWQANVARINDITKKSFHMDECKEFQLRRTRFKDTFKLSVHVSYPKHLAGAYPINTKTEDTTNWATVTLR